jgi:hypothetical protein
MDWEALAARAEERRLDGLARLPADADARQKQLVRVAMAAGAAALARLMQGRDVAARELLLESAGRYRESWQGAPEGSWGRPIGALKARLIAGDADGAASDARWALELGAAGSSSSIARYAATLAFLALGEDERAAETAGRLGADFPAPVADSLLALAAHDAARYGAAVAAVLESFESRDAYLEGVPVADTVLALESLARARGIAASPRSPLLPG